MPLRPPPAIRPSPFRNEKRRGFDCRKRSIVAESCSALWNELARNLSPGRRRWCLVAGGAACSAQMERTHDSTALDWRGVGLGAHALNGGVGPAGSIWDGPGGENHARQGGRRRKDQQRRGAGDVQQRRWGL